jgi:hypothetical protein
VMALFIRGICGPEYHRRAVEAASGITPSSGVRRTGRAMAGARRGSQFGSDVCRQCRQRRCGRLHRSW